MTVNSQRLLLAAAGAGGAAAGGLYVDDVFSTYLYTGNASTQTITNGIDLSGEGGMVWCKPRNALNTDEIVDTERGINSGLAAIDSRAASSSSEITSFNSDGYTLGYVTGLQNVNARTFASWTFRKAPGFFDVVTYTGNQYVPQTISHNLGSVPGCIIIKCTSTAGTNWRVYHRSGGATVGYQLDSADAGVTSSSFWNNTAPTSTEFTVGNIGDVNGTTSQTYVAYLFAHDDPQFGENEDESIIKCGSYTGPAGFINLGWEPQWVLIKESSSSRDWFIFDNMRGVSPAGGSAEAKALYPNKSNAEGSFTDGVRFEATGFTPVFASINLNSQTYIYIAIRRPHKPPEAGTDVFAADKEVSPTYSKTFTSGFPVDLTVTTLTSATSSKYWLNRVTGTSDRLVSNSNAAAFTGQDNGDFDRMDGWYESIGIGGDAISWMFRRAPGFFDMVVYAGTGSTRTIAHNLGVAPEFIIHKSRTNTSYGWISWHSGIPLTSYVKLDITNAASDLSLYPTWWLNNTSPTATEWTLSGTTSPNLSGQNYIAYLFATLAGISKVGSFSGTGSNVDVDCGFTAGARFVLVKRTDSTGDWYVWDSTRGIVSGNDPYLLLNSTAAEVTSTDYIDPLNSGFTVTSSAPAALNASGGTYIFLAIA